MRGLCGRCVNRLRETTPGLSVHRPPYGKLVEHSKCTGKEQLQTELDKVLKMGGEGLMIRKPKSVYEKTRSYTLLKIKKFHDAEVS